MKGTRKECPLKKAQRQRRWQQKNLAKINAYNAERRAKKRCATPTWANRERIREIYALARRASEMTGIKHHVDHIVPLTNPTVCGLHVEHNLQVLNGIVNQKKNNKSWPEMPT